MTGEVTLKGLVLPVGGIKEKVLAAHNIGMKKIIIPIKNKKDIEHLPIYIKKTIDFVFVNTIEDVLRASLIIK